MGLSKKEEGEECLENKLQYLRELAPWGGELKATKEGPLISRVLEGLLSGFVSGTLK